MLAVATTAVKLNEFVVAELNAGVALKALFGSVDKLDVLFGVYIYFTLFLGVAWCL